MTERNSTNSKRPAHKRRLTELAVRKFKPEASSYMVWDSAQRGLGLRVRPSGKSWFVVYSRHGRPRWLHIGNSDVIGLADARMMAAEALLAVAKGKDPAAEKRAERGSGTFADLAERYVEQYAKKRNKSWKQAAALVERLALPRWGHLQAAAITRADVKQMLARIAAPTVANQTLAAISAIFSWAVREEILPANPCKLVARNASKSRERVLSETEVPKFWAAFDDAGLVASSALKTILLTGQRPGEVGAMRREHIIKDGWWEMPGQPVPALGWPGTKNGKSHRVWLSAPVQALIAELTDDDAPPNGFVFTFGAKGRWPVQRLGGAMRQICQTLGAARATPHDLRRTFGSLVCGCGFGRQAMDRILNHADSSVGSIYDRHGYSTEDRHIMEATAARIMSLIEGTADDKKIVPLRR
jgi:integrase